MAKRGHTPRLATYRPIGSPLGRRTFAHWPHTTGCHSGQKGRRAFAHWPPLGHTLRDGAATWPKGSRPLPLPGLREPHHARPPTGQTGLPPLATLPPFGRPTGAYGHRLPHWPPTGHPGRPPTGPLLATKGREGTPSPGPPPTGKRDGRGSLWPHGSSSPPPLPGHRTGWGFSRAKGAYAMLPALTRPPLGPP